MTLKKLIFASTLLLQTSQLWAVPFLTTGAQAGVIGVPPTPEAIGTDFVFKQVFGSTGSARAVARADYGRLFVSGWKVDPTSGSSAASGYASFSQDSITITVPNQAYGVDLDVEMYLSVTGSGAYFLPNNFATVRLSNDQQEFDSLGSHPVSTLDSQGNPRFKNGVPVTVYGGLVASTGSDDGDFQIKYDLGISSVKYLGSVRDDATISAIGNYDWRPRNVYDLNLVLGNYTGTQVNEDIFTVNAKVYKKVGEVYVLIRNYTTQVEFSESGVGKLPLSVHGHNGPVKIMAEVTSANNDGFTTWLKEVVAVNSINTAATFNFVNGDSVDDGVIDIADHSLISGAFDATPSDPSWDQRADLNRDGIVDIADYSIMAANFDATDEGL